MATREKLTNIDVQVEDAIPVDELKSVYDAASQNNDQTLEALTRLTYKIEELSVSSKAKPAPSAAINNTKCPNDRFHPRSLDPVCRCSPSSPFMKTCLAGRHFWRSYNWAVYANEAVTATDKFRYLRNYLQDEAAPAMDGLPTTEACYESVVSC